MSKVLAEVAKYVKGCEKEADGAAISSSAHQRNLSLLAEYEGYTLHMSLDLYGLSLAIFVYKVKSRHVYRDNGKCASNNPKKVPFPIITSAEKLFLVHKSGLGGQRVV